MNYSYNSNFLRLLSYTKQLTSHVNQGRHNQALSLFYHIHSALALPLDPYVFPLTLKSCSALHCPLLGTSIHAHLTKSSLLPNPFVASALVDFYGKCVSLVSARQLFDEIPLRNDVVWNVMISLYAHSNNVSLALGLFESMDVAPNISTFNSIIDGLSRLDDGCYMALAFYRRMQDFGEIHGYSMRNNIDPNPQLRSCLVEAYGRCGCADYAYCIFCSMKERERDVVAWSSLISAYALHGEARKALDIFHEMEDAKVKPDGITLLGVLKACSHAGLADEAKGYISRMQEVYGVEITSDHYSCLVDVLSRAGKLYEAYDVLTKMPVKATAKAWGALLGACRTYGEVDLAEGAGRALFEIEPNNAANYVLLARIYASAGRYEEANKLRIEMKERRVKIAPGSSWV
uniref:Pentatricopeptide repeat-containing protein n=1 Tax=Chenopodium quinoa TaxID=63459 RepID=A0A803MF78_CHEQI